MEEYPSPVEGTGLENQEVGWPAQGFESLFLRQFKIYIHSVAAYHACLSRKRSRVQIPLEPPFGFIAQSVEQRTENPCVAGSIPAGATRKTNNSPMLGFFILLKFNNKEW